MATQKQNLARIFSRDAIVWAGVVFVLACGIFLVLGERRCDKDNGPSAEKAEKHLAQHKSYTTHRQPPLEKPEPTSKWPTRSPHPDGLWRHGEGPRSIAVTNGCLVTYPHCPGVQLVLPHPAFAAPFNNISDNEIARILSIKPGDDFIDAPLPADFDRRFAESILSPIEDSDDDTPEKADLKDRVREARKVLIDAVKHGESPRQILTEEAKNLRRMMQIRDNYQRLVNEQIQEGASDQDINDLVRAANQLLNKEGVEARVRLPYKTKLRIEHGKVGGTILE